MRFPLPVLFEVAVCTSLAANTPDHAYSVLCFFPHTLSITSIGFLLLLPTLSNYLTLLTLSALCIDISLVARTWPKTHRDSGNTCWRNWMTGWMCSAPFYFPAFQRHISTFRAAHINRFFGKNKMVHVTRRPLQETKFLKNKMIMLLYLQNLSTEKL